MSAERLATRLSELLAGRWQVPLALVAATVGGLTLYRLIPQPSPVDFDALLADVAIVEQSQGVPAAADAVAKLLDMPPPLSPAQKAVLHDRLAELVFRAEHDQPEHTAGNAHKILEHDGAARDLGHPGSPAATLRAALASSWLGEDAAARQELQAALARELPADDRRLALRAVVELGDGGQAAGPQRREALDELLSDESASPSQLWWALHRAVRDALDGDDAPRARELVERFGDRLKTSELKGYLDYLWARIALQEGRPEEAAPLVRWVDDWLTQQDRATRVLDSLDTLPALNRWLAGKVHLSEGRPEDALADFDEALEYRPGAELRSAAQLGRAQALAALSRQPEALEAFRQAAGDIGLSPERRKFVQAQCQQAVTALVERLRAGEDHGDALAYLELAAGLTPDDDAEAQLEMFDQVGRAYQLAAQDATNAELRRTYHEQAGQYLERAAKRATYDEPRLAGLLWSAGEEYDQAGRPADMRRMLGRFVAGRSDHPALPRALLQLGRAGEACGDLDEALTWYERVLAEYPRLEDAARARVLRAGVLVSLGTERYPDAEQELAGLLTEGWVAPGAAVHRDALLGLCELVYHEGRYGEAIGRLQDFLTLYPEDAEASRARFTLADAHRRSAYALRDDAANSATAAESAQRFQQAAELYEALLRDLDAAGEFDIARALYARLALFYRADCLFELNDPDTLAAALATYRSAAARYDGQPAALTAQVQIANVSLRLGQFSDAARAMERARWLLHSIPAAAFTACNGGDRAMWERFLTVVSSSDLFQAMFASAIWPTPASVEER